MGLVECIERFSFYNYCHWLALLPLAQMHPTKSPSIYNKTRTANYPNLYLTAARRTLSLSEAQPIVTHGSRTSEAAEITDGASKMLDQASEPWETQLARAWACTVLEHAPSVAEMNALLENDWLKRFARDDKSLAIVVMSKVEQLEWVSTQDWLALEQLLDASPRLWRSPRMATILLKHTSTAQQPEPTLKAVVRCLEAAEEYRLQDLLGIDLFGSTNELTGDWGELNDAAKAWLRRQHESERTEFAASRAGILDEQHEDETEGWQGWSGAGGWLPKGNKGKKKKKKKSKTSKSAAIATTPDAAACRVADLAHSCTHLNALLNTAFFGRNHRDLLLEMTHCWFFKGKPALILEAICRVTSQQQNGVLKHCVTLAKFIASEAKRMVAGRSPAEGMHLLEVVMEHSPPTISLAHDLLSALVSGVTEPLSSGRSTTSTTQPSPPSLENALVHHRTWVAVIKWFHGSGDLNGMNTVLVQQLNALNVSSQRHQSRLRTTLPPFIRSVHSRETNPAALIMLL